jgi:hypothetical protein
MLLELASVQPLHLLGAWLLILVSSQLDQKESMRV